VIIIAIIENPLDYLLDKHDWLKQKNIKKRIYISVSTTIFNQIWRRKKFGPLCGNLYSIEFLKKIKSSLQIPRTFNTDSSNN